MCTVCGMYVAGSCFDPATAAFLAVAAASASSTTTVPCPWAHSMVCLRCRTSWERKSRKTRTKKQMAGKLVQCATCSVWQDFATGFYKKDKRQYKNSGIMTCGTCRRLQCKYKLSGIPPPAPLPTAMVATTLPLSDVAGATPGTPYESSLPEYYSGAVGPQTTQTHRTPSPFLGHHPDPTNNYYYYQHPQQPPQPQYRPAAPVYYQYYNRHEQVPTTTTQYSSHRHPQGREEEEGGGGWNSATTQLQQQQQSRQNGSTASGRGHTQQQQQNE